MWSAMRRTAKDKFEQINTMIDDRQMRATFDTGNRRLGVCFVCFIRK